VVLNLASEAGRDVFRDLAREADIIVENFRVGKTAEWGLDYPDLVAENPGLIYCGLSGYGEWGPDRDAPAYDIVMQAKGGLMSITGVEDGPPVRIGVALADIGAGMYATQAILAALLERELGDGTGQKIDVSLLDGQAAWMSYMAANYFASGDPPGRMGSKHPNIAPYQAYETEDDYVETCSPTSASRSTKSGCATARRSTRRSKPSSRRCRPTRRSRRSPATTCPRVTSATWRSCSTIPRSRRETCASRWTTRPPARSRCPARR
jgi:crotonobetainyl-CoA:carnitine CoA-transferase CaiB-like acyl-CoA transferase